MSRRFAVRTLLILSVSVLLAVCWRWLHSRPSEPPTATRAPVAASQAAPATVTASPVPRHTSSYRDDPVAHEPGPDPEQVRCQQQRRRQLLQLSEQLQPQASPDDAIAHALLSGLTRDMAEIQPDPDAVGREFRAASRRWPQNLDLAWYALQRCSQELGCDRAAKWQHLRTLDGDNAVVWMWAMQEARQRHDTAAWALALHRAASSKIYDSRNGTAFLRVRPLLAALPMPDACMNTPNLAEMQALLGRPITSEDFADVEASAMESTSSMVGYAGLTPCRDSPSLSTASRQDCRALLAHIADGDTLVEQSLALSLQIQLIGDGPGHAQWRERYRRLRWLYSLMADAPSTPGFASRIWADGEVATLRDYAIAQGKWPPPPDWLPDSAREHSLILTGRLPK